MKENNRPDELVLGKMLLSVCLCPYLSLLRTGMVTATTEH